MNIFLKNLVCLIAIFSFFLVLPASQAAGLVPCEGPDCKPCDLFRLIVNITNFLFYQIAMPLAGLMFLIGGIMMISSGGTETRYKKGKEILVNTLFGLIIALAAFVIVNSLVSFFGSGDILDWSTVECS